jgi:deazaflavin-dependent oxidoreductase (nitroreductase family)
MSEASMADFHQRIMDEFRANDGVVPSLGGSSPLLVLHHVGAHSGAERSTPVRYLPTADGRYVIFGLNGGAPTHPAWYHNLKANPRAHVEVGRSKLSVLATEITGEQRDRLWDQQVAVQPQFGESARHAGRTIPVIVLTPVD